MFRVVEMPTGRVLDEFESAADANLFIENISESPEYTGLLSTYGTLRRVQQEITVESQDN
jgi:hypothetical protein